MQQLYFVKAMKTKHILFFNSIFIRILTIKWSHEKNSIIPYKNNTIIIFIIRYYQVRAIFNLGKQRGEILDL